MNHIPVLIICLPCLAALPFSWPSSLSLCPSFGCSAIEKFGNMKPPKYDLAAKQVKETMDKRYSPNWCCIIGLFFYFSPLSTSLAYLFRHLTYISSSFLALPSTLSKSNCFAFLWTQLFLSFILLQLSQSSLWNGVCYASQQSASSYTQTDSVLLCTSQMCLKVPFLQCSWFSHFVWMFIFLCVSYACAQGSPLGQM